MIVENHSDGGPGSGRYPKGSGGDNDKITTPSKSITEAYNEADGGGKVKVLSTSGKPYTFAGKGSKNTLRVESRLIADYGGTKGNWSHGRQKMKAERDGKVVEADVHYQYEPSVGYVEQKIKLWYDKEK
jgi:hypothetical protein